MYSDPSGHMPEWLQWTLCRSIVVKVIALSICTAGLATPIATAIGSGLFGAISGLIAGGVFGGIKHIYFAKNLANSVSVLSKAQSNFDNALKQFGNVKISANMPFESTNIVSTVGQAAANYNAAYTNLVIASVDNMVATFAFYGIYAAAQFGLKQLINYGINQIWWG